MTLNDKYKDMLSGISAVLFDLDGSLVDSTWIWGAIDVDFLGKYDQKCPPTLQKDIEGMSVLQTAQYFKDTFNIKDSTEDMIKCWNDMALDKYVNDVTVKPCGLEFLTYLKENGIKMGICSSNSRYLIERTLDERGIRDYFSSIVSGEDVLKGKPDPEPYLKGAKNLEVEPSKCLVFEDLILGIQSGHNAGMRVCAVRDEYSEYQWDEKKAVADYFIEDYRDLF